MKEIVVISGKGGTGKTSLTAAFAVLAGPQIVVADCDVDAADMHLLLAPDFADGEDFHGGELAVIDQQACNGCGGCAEVCRYGAIGEAGGRFTVDEISCEGCGYCARVCPTQAIVNVRPSVGRWYRSRIRTGSLMIHARLDIGADNSGKLVAKVKHEARAAAEQEDRKLVLVDGSPGIGCPVVSSLSGADLVVLVTEPTVAGLHDLKRVHELVERFGIPCGCIVNKCDLNADVLAHLRRFRTEAGIADLAELPYDEQFTAAVTAGRTIVEQDSALKGQVSDCWRAITTLVAAN